MVKLLTHFGDTEHVATARLADNGSAVIEAEEGHELPHVLVYLPEMRDEQGPVTPADGERFLRHLPVTFRGQALSAELFD